jgi:hypothetical protein
MEMFKLVNITTGRDLKYSSISDGPMLFKTAEEAESYIVLDFGCFENYDLVEVK